MSNIYERIGDLAKAESEKIEGSAKEAAAEKKRLAERKFAEEFSLRLEEVKRSAEIFVSGQQTMTRLEAGKRELGVKRELIEEVYAAVSDRIISLNDDDYRKFIASVIAKYAEDGDALIISEKDVKRLNDEWLAELSKRQGLSLCFEKEYHNDVGGIILRGKKYDKNLTVSAIVSEARKNTENAVVDRLFG